MAITEMNFPLMGEDAPDDLPRTLRREREAREREARERAHREREPAQAGLAGRFLAAAKPAYAEAASPSLVKDFDVRFARLVVFFIKAALAAVPGILLLGVVLWIIGQGLQAFFPELVKMQILVWFPN